MQLGIGSYTFPWAVGVPGYLPPQPMTAMDLLDRAAEFGIRLVQVADNLPLDRLSSTELDAFVRRAGDLGIRIEVGTRGIEPEHLHTYLRLAERLESPILRVVIDTPGHRPGMGEVVHTLQTVVPEFERAGVCLAIENHDRFKAKAQAEIVERMGSPAVGICLDTVNAFPALEGPEVTVAALGPFVASLCLKDFAIFRTGYQMGFTVEGRPAGQGRLDIPWLLQKLRDLGRTPNAILELWPPPEITLEETIAKEQVWAVASIRYLRRFFPS